MDVYITGIAGQLGYGLYQRLKEENKISGLDMIEVSLESAEIKTISLLDWEKVEEHIRQVQPQVLIHTAAFVNVDGCEEQPEMAEQLNHLVTNNLANLCHEMGIKMIYISTDAVFDGTRVELYTEEDEVNPVSVYAKTKLQGEYAVLKYPEHLVLRTNIYGINLQNKKSFGEWIYYSLKEHQTLTMFTDIDFSPIFIPEFAEIVQQCIQKKLSGLYHCCGTGAVTKYDFGVKMKEVFGIKTGKIEPINSEKFPFKAKRTKHMGMSNEKIRQALGIQISTPYESIERFKQAIEKEGK